MIQIYEPPPVELLRVKPGGPLFFTGILAFRVPTPDSRLTTSLSLLFTQPNGPTATIPFDVTFSGAYQWLLWLAGREQDKGGAGSMVPTVNLVGTRLAPLVIPSDVSIDAYADDFTGGQDEIYGELTVNLVGFTPSNGLRIALQVRYEPGPCAICDDEWLQIIASCAPSSAQPPVVA